MLSLVASSIWTIWTPGIGRIAWSGRPAQRVRMPAEDAPLSPLHLAQWAPAAWRQPADAALSRVCCPRPHALPPRARTSLMALRRRVRLGHEGVCFHRLQGLHYDEDRRRHSRDLPAHASAADPAGNARTAHVAQATSPKPRRQSHVAKATSPRPPRPTPTSCVSASCHFFLCQSVCCVRLLCFRVAACCVQPISGRCVSVSASGLSVF